MGLYFEVGRRICVETIRVLEQIGDRATDMKQGDRICQLIVEAFQRKEEVIVDFFGVKTVLSTFLNNAIGALYKNYTSEFLNRSLKLENLCEDDLFIVRRVTKRAREFYQNRGKIAEVLNEHMQ